MRLTISSFFTSFQKDRTMQRGMLIILAFLAQVVSGQNIGAILAEKQQEINSCFGRTFVNKEYGKYCRYYRPRGVTSDQYVPTVRVYFFADSLLSDTCASLLEQKMQFWEDTYIGTILGWEFFKIAIGARQAKDSLVWYLKSRSKDIHNLGIHHKIRYFLRGYLQPDAILYPYWLYYCNLDSLGDPIEWRWIKDMSLLQVERNGERERALACIGSVTDGEWLLKDGRIYTGVSLDSTGSLLLLGIQSYLDSLYVYPSFARYFNALNNGNCIPRRYRHRIVECLNMKQDKLYSDYSRKELHEYLYEGLYFMMAFPSRRDTFLFQDVIP